MTLLRIFLQCATCQRHGHEDVIFESFALLAQDSPPPVYRRLFIGCKGCETIACIYLSENAIVLHSRIPYVPYRGLMIIVTVLARS